MMGTHQIPDVMKKVSQRNAIIQQLMHHVDTLIIIAETSVT